MTKEIFYQLISEKCNGEIEYTLYRYWHEELGWNIDYYEKSMWQPQFTQIAVNTARHMWSYGTTRLVESARRMNEKEAFQWIKYNK